ncbi:MAG: DUF2281 domain-containing protein [Defluviitaleaceae bacterium]|nr:DUF2281 domain-containing protein [Defluviitaleaceae bacterium]
MLQTIQGYFLEDRFVPLQHSKIPSHVEVFVVVTDKPVPPENLTINATQTEERFPLFGCAKNKGGWVADDFDAPLEEMEAYM